MGSQDVLKIYVEGPGFDVGCCPVHYGQEEMATFPGAQQRRQVGALLVRLRERFGEGLRVDLIDPRSLMALGALFRFRLKGTEVAWVWRKKLIFRGIPAWEELEKALIKEGVAIPRIPPQGSR